MIEVTVTAVLTPFGEGLKKAPMIVFLLALSFVGWYGLMFLQPAFLLSFGFWQWAALGVVVHLIELVVFGIVGLVLG